MAINTRAEEAKEILKRAMQKGNVVSLPVNQEKKESEKDDKQEKKSQADILIELLKSKIHLFHDDFKEGFAKIKSLDHFEIHEIKSTSFKLWVGKVFYDVTKKTLRPDSIRQAFNALEGEALYNGKEHELSLRIAEKDGSFWYDLANDKWQAVCVNKSGWRVVDEPPILFRRLANTGPQVVPEHGGQIEELKRFINVKSDDDFRLLVVFIVSCLIPNIPKVLLPLHGEKGAGKSSAARTIRDIVDPALMPLVGMPKGLEDLKLLLYKNYLNVFDNLSGISTGQSDILCVASTGGGIQKRKLYTDHDEVILKILRPIILTGINEVATASDLLDRSLVIELKRIDEAERREERIINEEWKAAKPRILGAIFDILSKSMTLYPSVKIKRLPRMADFAKWGYAIAQSMGWSGPEFLAAYRRNLNKGSEVALENSPVMACILELMSKRDEWQGKPAKLLEALENIAEDYLQIDTKSRSWPKYPNGLSKQINKYISNLKDVGIGCKKVDNERKNGKEWLFFKISKFTSATSATSAEVSQSQKNQGFEGAEVMQRFCRDNADLQRYCRDNAEVKQENEKNLCRQESSNDKALQDICRDAEVAEIKNLQIKKDEWSGEL